MQPLCDEIVRTDRISQEILDWDIPLLHQLWKKRLLVYSDGQISNLNSLSETTKPYPIDELAFIFANHSPRDLIRIGLQILTEQVEINSESDKIQSAAIYNGISKFCSKRVDELFTNKRVLNQLRKVRQVDFTIPYLANEVFKEKQPSTRNRIMLWRKEAAITDVERIEATYKDNSRNVKLIAIVDIRVAREIFPELDITTFLEKKYRKCPSCGATLLRDWGDLDSSGTCHNCQYDLLGEQEDDLEKWRRMDLAAQNKRKFRAETLEPQAFQLSIFGEIENQSHQENADE